MTLRRVAVIGAGPGGLAAAMLLSQRGLKVEVFEKQKVIGGCNAEVVLGDYRFDLGPTDRKSTRLNSSHLGILYAVFCFEKITLRITMSNLFATARGSSFAVWVQTVL